jgi:PAS domain S-box-containing protein
MKRNIAFPDSSWSLILIMAVGFFLVEIAELLIIPEPRGLNDLNILLIDALIPTIIITPFMWWPLKSRHLFENALKESEERFRTLFDGSPDAIFLADPETGIIIDANSRASELTARPTEEIIGMHQSQLHPARNDEYSRRSFKEHARKTNQHEDIHPFENVVLRPDGTEVPVEVLAQMVTIKGRQVLQGVFRDITERKSTEKDMGRLINAINISTEGITIADENDRFIYVNAAFAEIFGHTPEELIGDTWRKIVPPEIIAPTEKGLSETIRNRGVGVFKGEVPGLQKDGNIIPTDVSATGFFDGDGKYQGHVCIVKDITERKRVEEQIEASLKEKEMLLREIHHRVKNNMQVISSLLWLQSGYIKDKKYLDMFRDSQNRIISMSLIHEKLYRSKDLAKIEFDEYIRDLVNGLFQSHGVKTGTIELKINVDNVSLGILHAIPCGLLINELITNSLKYAFPDDRKGKISVSLHLNNENMVELKVSDNGVGIPSDVDFRKTESLGLRLVTILVEGQLKGKIDLDRSRGTEFIIRFKGGY